MTQRLRHPACVRRWFGPKFRSQLGIFNLFWINISSTALNRYYLMTSSLGNWVFTGVSCVPNRYYRLPISIHLTTSITCLRNCYHLTIVYIQSDWGFMIVENNFMMEITEYLIFDAKMQATMSRKRLLLRYNQRFSNGKHTSIGRSARAQAQPQAHVRGFWWFARFILFLSI